MKITFFENLNETDLLLISLSFGVIIMLLSIILIERKLKKILRGKTGEDLMDSFKIIEKEYAEMKEFRDNMTEYLKSVEGRVKNSIQGTATVRFNPWKGNGEGGNQSFASAFVSEKGNGVVISSLYSRERVSVFAKPVENGKSTYELSGEEKEALKKASEAILGQK